jgi:hypothetical protein
MSGDSYVAIRDHDPESPRRIQNRANRRVNSGLKYGLNPSPDQT